MGRPRKPSAEIKLFGDYRADRHEGRGDQVAWPGKPQPPAHLKAHGAWLWTLITSSTPAGVLSEADSAALEALCRWWTVWKRFDALAAKASASAAYKHVLTASVAWKQVDKLLSRFGLTPADRARLKFVPETRQKSALEEFAGQQKGRA